MGKLKEVYDRITPSKSKLNESVNILQLIKQLNGRTITGVYSSAKPWIILLDNGTRLQIPRTDSVKVWK